MDVNCADRQGDRRRVSLARVTKTRVSTLSRVPGPIATFPSTPPSPRTLVVSRESSSHSTARLCSSPSAPLRRNPRDIDSSARNSKAMLRISFEARAGPVSWVCRLRKSEVRNSKVGCSQFESRKFSIPGGGGARDGRDRVRFLQLLLQDS